MYILDPLITLDFSKVLFEHSFSEVVMFSFQYVIVTVCHIESVNVDKLEISLYYRFDPVNSDYSVKISIVNNKGLLFKPLSEESKLESTVLLFRGNVVLYIVFSDG